jgi:hypothetical protein
MYDRRAHALDEPGIGRPARRDESADPAHPVTGYGKPIVVSCHVERPLDDRVWALFSRIQRRFAVAALIRPPHPGEDEGLWLERAREAALHGALGQHTHWTSPEHARPTGGLPGARVLEEGMWLRDHGLEPTLFCGGGWYIDEAVAEAAAELGYADCTATAFRPSYLERGAPRAGLAEPAWLRLENGRRLLELPSTHSLGMAARAALRPLPPWVHVYFHDTDLLDRRRRAALVFALSVLTRRRRAVELDAVAAAAGEVEFSEAASAR